ncbi:MAG: hypothetical protein ABIG71_02425 [Candidatus Uhrbacteria bacterium]
MIRLLGFVVFLLGALVVNHDLGTIAYGESDATVLALLHRFAEANGHARWEAFLMWILPMVMGAWMLLNPSTRLHNHQRRRVT